MTPIIYTFREIGRAGSVIVPGLYFRVILSEFATRGLMMSISNKHFAEVEILSFNARCKLDGMSYEQTVNIRTSDGSLIRLFDFMGFAVNESRLGKGKRIVLCVPYIDGEMAVLESGEPRLLENDFREDSEEPSRPTLIARVVEANREDNDLLVDAGFGKLYVLLDDDVFGIEAGDLIQFTARRVDLLEIIE